MIDVVTSSASDLRCLKRIPSGQSTPMPIRSNPKVYRRATGSRCSRKARDTGDKSVSVGLLSNLLVYGHQVNDPIHPFVSLSTTTYSCNRCVCASLFVRKGDEGHDPLDAESVSAIDEALLTRRQPLGVLGGDDGSVILSIVCAWRQICK